jgi:hypothetical protein
MSVVLQADNNSIILSHYHILQESFITRVPNLFHVKGSIHPSLTVRGPQGYKCG